MLKIKFWRIENSIAMKVLKQGEEIIRGNFEFKASNGITIKSNYCSQIAENYLYVRGDAISLDDNVITYDFCSIATSKKQLALYLEAIKEYNNSLLLQKSEDKENDIEIVIAE